MLRPAFTVCILLYGDYPRLADRLLASLTRTGFFPHFRLRIGLNAISAATERVLDEYLHALDVDALVFRSAENKGKYPVMRQMFYREPIDTPGIMWFDDDSYIRASADDAWFERVAERLLLGPAVQLGSLYRIQLSTGQQAWIRRQPWFRGRPVERLVTFCTGGWWAARTDALRRIDYPFPELYHNGGDVMLSVALQQQGHQLGKFNDDVAINADEQGRESAAPRRGLSTRPIGWDG